MQCTIKWIGCAGNPTPDNNPAVGFAVLKHPNPALGESRFPICAEHAKWIGSGKSHVGNCHHVTRDPASWSFEPF